MSSGYDMWKCSPPDPQHPDPPDTHEQCEDALEHAEDEIGQLHRQVEELELELAAERNKASAYGELYLAVAKLLPHASIGIEVSTNRYVHRYRSGGVPQPPQTVWRIIWFVAEGTPDETNTRVEALTPDLALAAFKHRLANPAAPASDPTGVSDLVRDADVGGSP